MARVRAPTPNNLPANLTTFVGREREIAEVIRLLAAARLVTLTGTGGCGKSRLAVEVARGLEQNFSDGVRAVELAALSEATLVPYAVAGVLEVPEHPGTPMVATLGRASRAKTILLVLDNCEHLRAACAHLADALLRECPNLRILATSRAPLGVPGETIWRVPSMSLPDVHRLPPPDDLGRYESIRLFAERAGSNAPGFRLTEANARALAEICHRLDGIPLAIELAAVRVRMLTAEQIAERLDDRFHLLTGGSAVVLPRHRTLRAAMDWSYELLSEQERMMLRRLSVFAGGWTLEAAEAVCSRNGVEASEVLDLLAQLVDTSLVAVEPQTGGARYRLLETIRQYGWDRLKESGEAVALSRRHRDWCLELAEQANLRLRGSEQTTWFRRLEADHDNLRAALERSTMDEDGAEAGLRLAWSLTWFWLTCGYVSEGRGWLEKTQSRGAGASASLRSRVLCGAGAFAERLGEYERARSLLEESLAAFRVQGDQWAAGFALHFLGHVASAQGESGRAMSLYAESLALFRDAGDTWGCALTLDCWGSGALRQGDYDRAASLHEESLALFRELGNRRDQHGPLSGLGVVAEARGDHARAAALFEESLKMAREIGHSGGVLTATLRMGRLVFRQGDCERAAALFKESLALRKAHGDRSGIAACLTALAGVAVAEGRRDQAARLFGAAEALRDAIHTAVPPAQRAEYDRQIAALRTSMDKTSFAAAWAEGRAMGPDEAVDYALALETSPRAPKSDGSTAIDRRVTLLTSREREVAALIAQGLTNREIAARLVVAERTAEGHVQSILNKLGVNSRARIAAWAVGHGLRAGSGDG